MACVQMRHANHTHMHICRLRMQCLACPCRLTLTSRQSRRTCRSSVRCHAPPSSNVPPSSPVLMTTIEHRNIAVKAQADGALSAAQISTCLEALLEMTVLQRDGSGWYAFDRDIAVHAARCNLQAPCTTVKLPVPQHCCKVVCMHVVTVYVAQARTLISRPSGSECSVRTCKDCCVKACSADNERCMCRCSNVSQLTMAGHIRQRFVTSGHHVWRLLQENPNQQMDAIMKSALLDLQETTSQYIQPVSARVFESSRAFTDAPTHAWPSCCMTHDPLEAGSISAPAEPHVAQFHLYTSVSALFICSPLC